MAQGMEEFHWPNQLHKINNICWQPLIGLEFVIDVLMDSDWLNRTHQIRLYKGSHRSRLLVWIPMKYLQHILHDTC